MPRSLRPVLALAVLASLAAPAGAAEPAADPCAGARTNMDLRFCASDTLRAADARLNDVYARALREVRSGEGDMAAAEREAWAHALRDAQRAWIAFRDADCTRLTPYEYAGGSHAPLAVLDCLVGMTEQRARDLAQRYLPQ